MNTKTAFTAPAAPAAPQAMTPGVVEMLKAPDYRRGLYAALYSKKVGKGVKR